MQLLNLVVDSGRLALVPIFDALQIIVSLGHLLCQLEHLLTI